MNTTLTMEIDAEYKKNLKLYALQQGITLRELVHKALMEFLAKELNKQ